MENRTNENAIDAKENLFMDEGLVFEHTPDFVPDEKTVASWTETWRPFADDYANCTTKAEKEAVFKKYSSTFIKLYIDKFQTLLADPTVQSIDNIIKARKGVTIDTQAQGATEIDQLNMWDDKGNFIGKTYDEKGIRIDYMKGNDVIHIQDSRYTENDLKKQYRIQESANHRDVVKLEGIAAGITSEILRDINLPRVYFNIDMEEEPDMVNALNELNRYLQDNLAKISLETLDVTLSMDESRPDLNRLHPSIKPAVDDYVRKTQKNSSEDGEDYRKFLKENINKQLAEIEQNLKNPDTIIKGIKQFDLLMSKEQNVTYLNKHKTTRKIANKIRADIIDVFSNAFTLAADNVFRQSVNNTESDKKNRETCSNQTTAIAQQLILGQNDPKKRNLWMKRLITTADHLTKKGDYFSAQAIVQAFSSSDIAKIIGDKNQKPNGLSKKSLKTLNKLQSFYSPANEHALNKHIQQHQGPKIPPINTMVPVAGLNPLTNLYLPFTSVHGPQVLKTSEKIINKIKNQFDQFIKSLDKGINKIKRAASGNALSEEQGTPILTPAMPELPSKLPPLPDQPKEHSESTQRTLGTIKIMEKLYGHDAKKELEEQVTHHQSSNTAKAVENASSTIHKSGPPTVDVHDNQSNEQKPAEDSPPRSSFSK